MATTRNRVLETTYDLTRWQTQRAQQPAATGAGAASLAPSNDICDTIGVRDSSLPSIISNHRSAPRVPISSVKKNGIRGVFVSAQISSASETHQHLNYTCEPLSDKLAPLVTTRTANGHETDSAQPSVSAAIKCDIEMARFALAMCLSALFRLWLVLHNLSSENNGAQGFSRLQLDTALHRYAVQGCTAYISRLLQAGAGKFWRIDAHGTIFPLGYTVTCKYLIQYAADNDYSQLLEAGNLPGSHRDMFVSVSGSMKDFEAHILDGWYACHNNPMITRFSLEILFQRSDVTLRKLEHRARVRHTYNTAETLEPAAIPLNAKGELRFHRQRKNRRGQTVYRFQLANTYHASRVRQNPHRGQGRKTAAVIRAMLTDLLTGNCGAEGSDNFRPLGENNRPGRLYYADYQRVRQARRKGRVGIVYSPARPGERGHVTWDVWV